MVSQGRLSGLSGWRGGWRAIINSSAAFLAILSALFLASLASLAPSRPRPRGAEPPPSPPRPRGLRERERRGPPDPDAMGWRPPDPDAGRLAGWPRGGCESPDT